MKPTVILRAKANKKPNQKQASQDPTETHVSGTSHRTDEIQNCVTSQVSCENHSELTSHHTAEIQDGVTSHPSCETQKKIYESRNV